MTPARGDETNRCSTAWGSPADHPRARGRDGNLLWWDYMGNGSPPRAGTRQVNRSLSPNLNRITPARGDETACRSARDACVSDHPRARGRDDRVRALMEAHYGSPPRAGTRRDLKRMQVHHVRITPARGDETLVPKSLISRKTSFPTFGHREMHLRRLEP
jgi:hypothetical protein